MFEDLLKRKEVNINALTQYGFIKINNYYLKEMFILDNTFKLIIKINEFGNITTDVIDTDLNEPYTLFKTSTCGEFASKVKQIVLEKVDEIISTCYKDNVFKGRQAKATINYINPKYSIKPEYLWDKYPDYSAFRKNDTKKWFATLMRIPASKLSIDSKEMIEVINLKASGRVIEEELKIIGIYPAYHMNKKTWYTAILDNTLSDDDLFKRIDESYSSAK